MRTYHLVFDEVIIKQLKKARKNNQVKEILSKMLDRIEERGPDAGKLLDSHLRIYEMKSMHPPIRLYFKHNMHTNEIYVFEYEMKTSEQKQQSTIGRIKDKILKSKIVSSIFFSF